MPPTSNRSPEVVMPAASLAALRRSLTEQLGPDAAAAALQSAGHAVGDAFHALLLQNVDGGGDLGTLPEQEFWRRLGELLATRGWGQLRFEEAHEGVGAIIATGWCEADADGSGDRPTCFVSTGLLSNLLGHVAGSDVGVFEVECRSRGDAHCRFLFGSAESLEAVYESMMSGRDVEGALAGLR